jgi:high-affinity K+ transport system ATPase subunit B
MCEVIILNAISYKHPESAISTKLFLFIGIVIAYLVPIRLSGKYWKVMLTFHREDKWGLLSNHSLSY